ncbi:ATP-binding protein [Streptomyces formicae]|uniref:Putative regulator n=1 Tax=Streptomyces formicae TaxID=1616117 RepID=A0A291Q797_9ACTN|nr:regulator [Streptomyces formicae]ATL27650.1 putative regulator [Streptomyces formicae]
MNLPSETTSFVGRAAELREISHLLTRTRLVTLTGVGGVGKSRLALRAAHRLQDEYADGARLVQLAPLRDASLLGHVLLEELNLADPTLRPPEELVAEWLADKQLLLVLDSCEHLVTDCARLARTLLDTAPGLRILVTSRQPLGARGERGMEVDPLPVPRPPARRDAPPEHSDALTLFAERAATALPGFELCAARRASAAAVCRRLDGIPLAIELAAAQLAELSLEQLADRIQHRFDALTEVAGTGTGTAALPRHRTLRTTIGWSHELCTPLERLLWARLSVFNGGFDLGGARAVGAGGPIPAGEVEQLLDGLVAKSLVRRRSNGGERPPRYDMLDTVREYGVHWLRELDEEYTARCAHRDHHLDLALQADAEWLGPHQVDWYNRLAAEHANLRTALEFCLSEGQGRTALEMAGALWFFWFACGFTREGRHYLGWALDLCDEPGPVRAKAVWACGVAAIAQGDTGTAWRLAAVFREAVADSADPDAAAAAAYLEGAAQTLRGNQAAAAAVFASAPEPPHGGGAFPAARFLNQVTTSFVHVHRGEFAAAAEVADALCARCEKLGERWMHAWAQYTRALAAVGLGRPAEAAAHARAALRGKALLHDTVGVGMAVDLLASTTADSGHGVRAARLLGIGQRIWQTVGLPQMGMPELLAARERSELRIRECIGDAAYEVAYGSGLDTDPEDGLDYALAPSP